MKDKQLLKNLLLYFGLAIMVSGSIFIQNLDNLDEIWVFNFAKCIADGLLPYRDFSIIITPLFPMVCAGFLKIFGNELLVLRVLECLETAAVLFTMYKIMERLKINKGITLCFIIGIFYIYSEMFCFDYNWTVLLIELIVLYVELKYKDKELEFNFKKEFSLGLLARSSSTL